MNLKINKKILLTEMMETAGRMAGGALNKAKTVDLNNLRDKGFANGGMLIGGSLAGGGMMEHMLADGNDLGSALIGGGVLGAAGAGIGQVIHNQFKKNNESNYNNNFDYNGKY